MKELNNRYKVAVCGHFGGKRNFFDGQTIKTKNIADCLEKEFGSKFIARIDTFGGKKRILIYLGQLLGCLKKSDNVIILPAQNGIRILAPFLAFFNRFFHKKLHYAVIGGWLPSFLEQHTALSDTLMKFDYIYVETSTMKTNLELKGFSNVLILPNFKDLEICNEYDLCRSHKEPYRICIFSRITKNKGIEDIAVAIDFINKKLNRCVYKLDIYGSVEQEYKNDFQDLQERYKNFVCYKGVVAPNKSSTVLKNYFFLAFPTRFYTEGIPGTIIDAYSAGIPVVSAKWESYSDVVDEGLSGFGYSMGNNEELISILLKIVNDPDCILNMKEYCLKKAKDYTPDAAFAILRNNF